MRNGIHERLRFITSVPQNGAHQRFHFCCIAVKPTGRGAAKAESLAQSEFHLFNIERDLYLL
jgi:hypothetical protein